MGAKKLGVLSGVGLTMADMVGVGGLTTAGFMAADLSPGWILFDWLVGGLVAMCGALAYAALARLIPKSGGEYRYLSSVLHPSLGYLAGWTSLLVGFSVPVALAALGAGAFAQAVYPEVANTHVAAALIVAVTAMHAVNMRTSKLSQDVLALAKAVLVALFILIGFFAGTNTLPEWTPPPGSPPDASGFAAEPFFVSLIFISFCYSGWNAATYASEEFENPRRDVPRAMVIGCLLVAAIYLAINWVFVTNLSAADMVGWVKGDTDRITLAHLVTRNLVGEGVATTVSVLVIIALASAISAMTLIGPRVYAAMAADGFLPKALAGREGKPPLGSVLLQGSLATCLVYLSGFRELLNNVSSILAIVSAITVLSLFRRRRWRGGDRPGLPAMLGAIGYSVMSGWMVYHAVRTSKTWLGVPTLVLWMMGIVAIAMVAYLVTRVLKPAAGAVGRRRSGDDPNVDWVERRAR